MLNDLNTSVATVSAEALDKLFDDNPAPITANDLIIGKQSGVQVEAADKKDVIQVSQSQNVPTLDVDSLDFADDEKVEEKKETETPVVKAEEEVKQEVEDKKEENKEDDENEAPEINSFLKTSVNYLIEKGIFKDFEGREDIDFDDETFAKLLEQQVAAKVEETYNEKKLSTGEYGQAILDYLEDGGDPDQIIDIFKERKEIQEFSLDSDEAKSELIAKWYKEVHGWKADKIKKYIDGLNTDESLDSEADEIKSKYDEHYKKQVDELKEQQNKYNAQQEQRKKEFENSLSKAIDTNKEFDDKRKRLIKDSIFKFKTLQDGTKVNALFEKFAEVQSNPELYVDFAEFILDKEGYFKRRDLDVQNKVTEKQFNFVKGNTALSKTKGSKHTEVKNEGKHTGTDFRVIFKK